MASPRHCKTLANQFLAEIQGVIATSEIYGEAHDALFRGYFENLKQYQQAGDFGIKSALRQLPRPRPLPAQRTWKSCVAVWPANARSCLPCRRIS